MESKRLTTILFLVVAVLIMNSFVMASYSIANEEYVRDISEGSEDDSNECGDMHNMMDEHHEESRHSCH